MVTEPSAVAPDATGDVAKILAYGTTFGCDFVDAPGATALGSVLALVWRKQPPRGCASVAGF